MISVLKRELQRIEKECYEEERECRKHIEEEVYTQNQFKNCFDGLEGIQELIEKWNGVGIVVLK